MKLNAGRDWQASPCMYILAGVSNCGFQGAAQTECCTSLQVCGRASVKLECQLWAGPHICLAQHLIHDSRWIPEEECEHSKLASYFSHIFSKLLTVSCVVGSPKVGVSAWSVNPSCTHSISPWTQLLASLMSISKEFPTVPPPLPQESFFCLLWELFLLAEFWVSVLVLSRMVNSQSPYMFLVLTVFLSTSVTFLS